MRENPLILVGDCREQMHRSLQDNSVDVCVTSPPYFNLRDYGHPEQIGREETPSAYIENLVSVFREVRRVLKDDGILWINIGDSYNSKQRRTASRDGFHDGRKNRGERLGAGGIAGLKPKDLIGIPWTLAFALRADGWYLRQDIIWQRPNAMPESVRDRCTKSHEYIFLLSRSERYYFNAAAINNKSSNKRSVWKVSTTRYKEAHFAAFPKELIRPCIRASRAGGVVLDPFAGSGTTGEVAIEEGRGAILCELNPAYVPFIEKRIAAVQVALPF